MGSYSCTINRYITIHKVLDLIQRSWCDRFASFFGVLTPSSGELPIRRVHTAQPHIGDKRLNQKLFIHQKADSWFILKTQITIMLRLEKDLPFKGQVPTVIPRSQSTFHIYLTYRRRAPLNSMPPTTPAAMATPLKIATPMRPSFATLSSISPLRLPA